MATTCMASTPQQLPARGRAREREPTRQHHRRGLKLSRSKMTTTGPRPIEAAQPLPVSHFTRAATYYCR